MISDFRGLGFNMKTSQDSSAKISAHFSGLGTVTREMVTQRAKELAQISARDHFSDSDWNQARAELTGHSTDNPNDVEESVAAVTSWDEAPGTTGHHTPNKLPTDDAVVEELVEGGVEEATHDQMLAGSRPERDLE